MPSAADCEVHEAWAESQGYVSMGIIVFHDFADYILEAESHFMAKRQRQNPHFFCVVARGERATAPRSGSNLQT